jgi:fucose 4-O-acetylase-like acetyltransferase
MKETKRIEYIDFIKGVCIFLVVWAHTIQNMGDGQEFWNNPVHVFICSFHMPIFMLLSGFFFAKAAEENLVQGIRRRWIQLIVPCFGWSLVLVALQTGYELHAGGTPQVGGVLKTICVETFTRFWFLRSVFICFTVAIISLKVVKNDVLAFVPSFALFLALPDTGRIHLDKFMYPFFWMGYFVHKEGGKVRRQRKALFAASALLFLVLLVFYRKEDYIYITPMSLYNLADGHFAFVHPLAQRIGIIAYRYAIGAAGSIVVFLLLQRLYRLAPHTPGKVGMVRTMGRYTLGIYVIHIFIEGHLLSRVDLLGVGGPFLFDFVLTPLVSAGLILLCIALIKVLEKNKVSAWLFLGKRMKPQRESL